MTVLITNFSGHCLLGVSVTQIINASQPVVMASIHGNGGRCAFVELMGFVALFMSIGLLVWHSYVLFNLWQSSWQENFAGTAISAALMILMLIASSVLTSSVNKFCLELRHNSLGCHSVNYHHNSLWIKFINSEGKEVENIHTTGFYTLLQLSQVGGWLCFLTLVAVTMIYNAKQRSSSFGQPVAKNIGRERQRLFNGDQRRYDQIS
ncbi:hypothetical protein EB796_014305 [Bugula neritina]|uniref:Uncharacterized protein n=1 Tax=Bugula neritina TaxID=10212 RepID=A0A7J7JLY7_BUGNE|nr:hypothetical protein EB796_014305 [Bugula neritina]